MALYFLSYDVRKANNYEELYSELEKFKAVNVLESVWSFERNHTTAAELREHFKRFVKPNDGMLVIKATEWASQSLDGKPPTPASWA
ncbi:conserved hypothetical protein [Burkholderia diffusa]|uniref:CRISPR-associated endonuclease Cas2 n=1 Tax=unclassified Burkholderia TaxID=2613784 RepID=UPI000A713D65|nr:MULTISPECIES: CRISPR-associated endonuclease Cas2 [Burkholderia]CAG9247006.1 conserved hypothetical protein [Burkholderia diffusa]